MAGAALAVMASMSPIAARKKGKNKKKKCRKLNQGCGGKKKCCKGLVCTSGTCQQPGQSECVADSDCGANEICQNGICVPECVNDNDCGANEICQNGACVPAPECAGDGDCDGNEICDDGVCLCPEIEDGRCIKRCDDGGDCPGASECANLSPEDAQTIVDGACVDIGTLVCSVPPCTANSECLANEICVMLRCDGDIPVGRCHSFSVF
jgi:hypothetical protein